MKGSTFWCWINFDALTAYFHIVLKGLNISKRRQFLEVGISIKFEHSSNLVQKL